MNTPAYPCELNVLRCVHRGVARRAAEVWARVMALNSTVMLLPVETTVAKMADAIYFNSRYDAYERYECVEEFAEALKEDLDTRWTERVSHAGGEHFVLRPFFGDGCDNLHALGLSYLRGCALSELKALDAHVPSELDAVPSGLSEEELEAVAAFHRRKTVTMLNALRHLYTALHYVKSGVERDVRKARASVAVVLPDETERKVSELLALVDLPIEPRPTTYFGTEADRVNPLRALPSSVADLELLSRL